VEPDSDLGTQPLAPGRRSRWRFSRSSRWASSGLAFDEIFDTEGIEVIRMPIQAPNANAYHALRKLLPRCEATWEAAMAR
jgi:hypothetical protein